MTMASISNILNKVAQSFGYVPTAKKTKKLFGGKLNPPPVPITRWVLADVEDAVFAAQNGNVKPAAQLMAAAQRDGVVKGVLSTLTDGLVRLPVKFTGDEGLKLILEGEEKDGGRKGAFQVMCPPGELSKMAGDGRLLGFSIARMMPVSWGSRNPHPYVDRVLQRLNPQQLFYRFDQDQWYYNSLEGQLPVTPGDGEWVLYLPGGYNEPWEQGIWAAIARSYIVKEHAIYNRQSYSSKVASPARIGYTKENSTEKNRFKFLNQLVAWANPSFVLPEGWDVKVIESTGKAFEIFQDQVKDSNDEIIIAIAGQLVTTEGNKGFSNGSIHEKIRMDIIQGMAESLAQCINEQVLLPWTNRHKASALATAPEVSWDTTPPADQAMEADKLAKVGAGIKAVNEAASPYGKRYDIEDLQAEYEIKLVDIDQPKPEAPMVPAPIENVQSTLLDDPTPAMEAALAEEMTRLGLEMCEHNKKNRCRICGIERDRGVCLDENGQVKWKVAWKAIDKSPESPQGTPPITQ